MLIALREVNHRENKAACMNHDTEGIDVALVDETDNPTVRPDRAGQLPRTYRRSHTGFIL